MSNALTDLRAAIVAGLQAQNFSAFDVLPENATPPCVWVVPADPYVTHEGAGFGRALIVRHQVNFAAAAGVNVASAEQLDAMLLEVLDALDALTDDPEAPDLITGDVDRVGTTPIGGQNYLAATVNVSTEIRRN